MTSQPDSIHLLQELKDAVRETYDKEQRKGIHVSDLTLCIRKSVRHRLDPAPLTDIDLRNFNQGKSHHQSIQQLAKRMEKKGYKIEKEKQIKLNGIVGHIDLVINDKIPVEMKGTRQHEAKPSDHYILQLKAYMCFLDSDVGYVLVESYNAEKDPWSETPITMTKEERVEFLKHIENNAALFKMAIENENWLDAPGVMYDEKKAWQCHKWDWRGKKIIRECPYKKECWTFESQTRHGIIEVNGDGQLLSIKKK